MVYFISLPMMSICISHYHCGIHLNICMYIVRKMDSSGASMITQSSSISMLSSGGPLPRRNSKRLPVTTLAASDRMSLNDAAKLVSYFYCYILCKTQFVELLA